MAIVWTASSGYDLGNTPNFGSVKESGTFTPGQKYVIVSPGTTDFKLIGAPNNNIGTVFVAVNSGSKAGPDKTAGSGTASETWINERVIIDKSLPIITNVNWTSNRDYTYNDIISYNNVYYICIIPHTSGTTFSKTFWSEIIFTKLSGQLPVGLQLNKHRLVGTPLEVKQTLTYNFVIRMQLLTTVFKTIIVGGQETEVSSKKLETQDRAFSLTVQGPDEPVWITEPGNLPVGNNNLTFILDNSYINYHLSAIDNDLSAGDNLLFYIDEKNGVLPSGITLSKDGWISGIVGPIKSLVPVPCNGFFDICPWDVRPFDLGIQANIGFDHYNYDTIGFDYNEIMRIPRKLNRTYEFIVSVTDGITVTKRLFQIYVVGEDFLSVDNTLMRVSTNVFKADNTYIRNVAGYWMTPKYIGVKRANNFVTLFLDVIDPLPYTGPLVYQLADTNLVKDIAVLTTNSPIILLPLTASDIKEGMLIKGEGIPTAIPTYVQSVTSNNINVIVTMTQNAAITGSKTLEFTSNSTLPPGLALDENTGEIFGYLPYQPAISKEYTFTVNAIKYDTASITQAYIIMFIRVNALIGDTTLKVIAASENDLELLIDEYVRIGDNVTHIYKITSQELDPTGFSPNHRLITLNKPLLGNINRETEISKNVIIPGNTKPAATTPRIFTVRTIGEIESTIQWITSNNLGYINSNFNSLLKVEAISTISNAKLSYTITDGHLPSGLTMLSNGEIVGKVQQFENELIKGLTYIDETKTTFDENKTTFDRTFIFTVQATDQYNQSSISDQFVLTVISVDQTVYSNIFIKAFLSREQRLVFSSFVNHIHVFEPKKIYRYGDPNFGVQQDLKMLIMPGIETRYLNDYLTSLEKNITRKRYKLGDLKLSFAKYQGTNNIVYEIIYLDVIDDYEINNVSVSESITIRNTQYFPTSVTNIRNNFSNIIISDESEERFIYTDYAYLPLWMQTPQSSSTAALGYTKAIPICYCKPGQGKYILENIQNYMKLTGFSFTQFNFDIDRFIVDSSIGKDYTQYLEFHNYKYNI